MIELIDYIQPSDNGDASLALARLWLARNGKGCEILLPNGLVEFKTAVTLTVPNGQLYQMLKISGGDDTRIVINAPSVTDLLRFQSFSSVIFDRLIFQGVSTQVEDLQGNVISLDTCEQALFLSCRFYGIKVFGFIINIGGCDTVFENTFFGGCGGNAAIGSTSYRGLSLLRTRFIDYGRLDGYEWQKSSDKIASWVDVRNGTAVDAEGQRRLYIEDSRFDEAPPQAITARNLNAVFITGSRFNIYTTLNGLALKAERIGNIQFRQNATYSLADNARYFMQVSNCGKTDVDAIVTHASAKMIQDFTGNNRIDVKESPGVFVVTNNNIHFADRFGRSNGTIGNGWETIAGVGFFAPNASIVNSQLVMNDVGTGGFDPRPNGFTRPDVVVNYVIECDLLAVTPGSQGANAFRLIGSYDAAANSYYFLEMGYYGGSSRVGKVTNGVENILKNDLQGSVIARSRLVKNGDKIQYSAQINGADVILYEYEDNNPLAAGKAGIVTAGSTITLDNFRLWSIPDTTAPKGDIIAPLPGQAIAGTKTLQADVRDDVAVQSVQFKLDGANVGSPITTKTNGFYEYALNTVSLENKTHKVGALAKDTAGNSRELTPVLFSVLNMPPDIIYPVTPYFTFDAEKQTGLTDGQEITTVTDTSGNNRNAGTDTGYKPLYQVIAGKPTFRFGQGSTAKYIKLGNLSALTEGELFVVGKIDVDPPATGQSGLYTFGTSPNSSLVPASAGDGGLIYDSFGTTARKNAIAKPSSMAVLHIYSVYSKASDWANFLNGVQLYQTNTNTVGFASACYFGNSGSGIFTIGNYRLITLFPTKLTTLQRSDFVANLKAHYGIQ